MKNDPLKFRIREGTATDIDAIAEIMDMAAESMPDPDWFVADDRNYISECIHKNGKVIVSEAGDGNIAGFFMIRIPDPLENMGKTIGLSEKECKNVIYMDSAAVKSEYRGNHLQRQMEIFAEQWIRDQYAGLKKEIHLLCTVHPQNLFSLRNMTSNGFEIMLRTVCYGEKDRYILKKDIRF